MFTDESLTYFAARSPEETASAVLNKSKSFYNVLEANAYLTKLKNSWKFYHGSYESSVGYGHQIEFSGEQGELVKLPVNHYRNLAQHMLNIICANRPNLNARAVNTDYKSLSQTYLANGILDYYMRQKNLEDYIKRAVEMAIVMGTGFVKLEWNSTGGEIYDADEETGQFNYEGEIEFSNPSPFDVIVDGTKENWDNDWVLVRSWENRYNLIAKYPELKDKILALPTKEASSIYRLALFSNDDTDDVPVYEFFHRSTEAMPDGRYLLFLSSDTILLDTKMPYRTIPVFRIVAGEILGTPYGYTPMFDVMPLQEGINSLYSTIMTNQNAFGVQNLWVPRGSDINVNTLEGAMNVIEGNPGMKPEPLNLTATPPEIFKFLELLIQTSETISGISSVTRGNPEASLKSGNALALVQSMSLQFISGLQQSYVKMIESVGTNIINTLKDFALTPKIISLVGKNNRTFLKEFTGEDLNAINRVICDIGNPLSVTTAGRVQMAEQMLQMGLIKTPQEYFQVINTGSLESMYEGEMSELLLIKQENETLMEGKQVTAAMIDAHKQHIMEHKAVLADPDLRNDNTLVQNVLQHIQDHINYLRSADPQLLQLIGEQPLEPPGQQMPGGPMPPGPMGGPQGAPQPGMQHMLRPMNKPGQPPPHPSNGVPMAPPSQIPPQALKSIQNAQNPNAHLPQSATPPKPFNTMPTDPRQIIPQ